MKFFTLIKPIPINQKLKRGKGNRLYSSKDYKDSWNAIQLDFMNQAKKQNIIPDKNNYFIVNITHSYKRYDIDSITKSVLDILQGIVYKNDNQVIYQTVFKDAFNYEELNYLLVECNIFNKDNFDGY